MEDEIDLRAYVTVLLRNWPWIVVLALVFAAVAFVVSTASPKIYEASAVVLVTEPRYQLQFDSRFDTEEVKPAAKAFPTLATSDTVLQAVVDAYVPPPAAEIERWNVATVSRMVRATSEGDPSLVVLTVQSRSPEAAAGIANAWARALADRGNDIYSSGQDDILFFEQQLVEAETALDQADAALVDFEARNEGEMLRADLAALSLIRADYLASQRTASGLIQDLRGLRSQWVERPADQPATLADGVTALFLQIRAFNGRLLDPGSSQVPITVQIGDQEAFLAQSRDEQIAFLDSLAASMEAQSSEIESALVALEPQVLGLQQEIQSLQAQKDRLTGDQQRARETYLTLARKLDEARIAAGEESRPLQVGSSALVPGRPVGPRRLFNTAIGGVLGAMLGVVAAFAIEFWRQGRASGERPALAIEG